jgi:hypothetical protein
MARVPTEVFHSHPNLLDCIERGENPVGRVFVDKKYLIFVRQILF